MARVVMDTDLPQGVGIVLDAMGREIARIDVPGGKRPEGAHTLVLSVEDYAQFLRVASSIGPRWIADETTMQLSERQADGSYKVAYIMVPIGDVEQGFDARDQALKKAHA